MTITDILSAPLDRNWTMDGLVERVLNAIAALPPESEQEFALDDTTDRQVRRLIRPLLACLANKSASEAGIPVNLYGGHFSFQRPSPAGPVWVVGDFENQPGSVRVTLRLANRPSNAPQFCLYPNGIILHAAGNETLPVKQSILVSPTR